MGELHIGSHGGMAGLMKFEADHSIFPNGIAQEPKDGQGGDQRQYGVSTRSWVGIVGDAYRGATGHSQQAVK